MNDDFDNELDDKAIQGYLEGDDQTDFLDDECRCGALPGQVHSTDPADCKPMPPRLDEDIALPYTDPLPSEVAESKYYGGEGFGVVRRRNLLVLMPLPEYLKDKEHPERGIDYSLQGMMLEGDIREAMAKAARKLNDTAMKYSVTGYSWDLNDIYYDMPQPRTVSATLVIERE